ncbi:hypothetical protein F4782DRAFT_503580 [Xylaria castorea]|nr:hypothetical protein F4782DRAFT_503580 [Xylaria castorea]
MWEMMVISMLNYQANEYMESVLTRLAEPSSEVLGMMIGTHSHSFAASSALAALTAWPPWSKGTLQTGDVLSSYHPLPPVQRLRFCDAR